MSLKFNILAGFVAFQRSSDTQKQKPGFGAYANHALTLTPLTTVFRYPNDIDSPKPEHAQDFLGQATEIVTYASKGITADLAGGRLSLAKWESRIENWKC
jgi:hypothetical protein